MTTTDIASLNAELDAEPDNWDAMRIISDAYEDDGNTALAAAYRWCAENGKRPSDPSEPGRKLGDWRWYSEFLFEDNFEDNPSPWADIPGIVLDAIPHYGFPTRHAAMSALGEALNATKGGDA